MTIKCLQTTKNVISPFHHILMEKQSTTEKPWWTDLQEKREQFKAAKIRAQSLSFNNGKIINTKRPPISSTNIIQGMKF